MAALSSPQQDGTRMLEAPSIDASVSVYGEVQLHIKPTVSFGIVFDSQWNVPDCSASLVMDGYVIFHAQASASLNGDRTCPFSYGIDAGADMYAQLSAPPSFNWGGQYPIPVPGLARRQILGETCVGGTSSKRDLEALGTQVEGPRTLPQYGNFSQRTDTERLAALSQHMPAPRMHLSSEYESDLMKRDTFSIGPIITIPQNFLNCPQLGNDSGEACPICEVSGNGGSSRKRSDGGEPIIVCPLIPAPEDDYCGGGDIQKRANSPKGQ